VAGTLHERYECDVFPLTPGRGTRVFTELVCF
jgi:hypothetical protein